MTTFLEIVPNNIDCEHLFEPFMKLILTNKLSIYNDEFNDNVSKIIKYITVLKNEDPSNIINKNFGREHSVIPFYISDDNKYYYCLIANTKNEKINECNSLASSIAAYCTNSRAFFGNVYIVGISKEYFNNGKIETSLYSNFDMVNYVICLVSSTYVRIFEPHTGPIYYSRKFIDTVLQDNTSLIETTNNMSIIKFKYNNFIIYAKTNDPIPESEQHTSFIVGNKIFYLINILDCDIQNIKL